MKTYKTSLFIFRRDLRLSDNTGLNNALAQSEQVIPCFIFDPRQVTDTNKYKSDNALQFMMESLQELTDALHHKNGKLHLFYGKAEDAVKDILKHHDIHAVFINRDYTPFSIERDIAIAQLCKKHGIAFKQSADALLNEPEDVLKKDGSHYSIFTAFYKKAVKIPIKQSEKQQLGSFFNGKLDNAKPQTIFKKIATHINKAIAYNGGSSHGQLLLKHIDALQHYKHDRDYPSVTTSHLSAHLKFGTVSVRQAYETIVKHLGYTHPLIKQLYWRDFFTHIAFHVPTVFGHPYHKKYAQLPWNYDKKLFKQWCQGTTGFPIVDAGMRELNETGFMHNRARMIVASFLVKDLHIDWLWGEKYFAQKLADYDPAVNNGNWQWCASTGCDAQPYFRIFNPWLQQKKYDPECTYIKKWVPELEKYDATIIHNWFKNNNIIIKNYPRPIVDHAKEAMIAKLMYKKKKN